MSTNNNYYNTTPYLNLTLPQPGTTNWGASINRNFSIIDTQTLALHNELQRVLKLTGSNVPWVHFTPDCYFVDFISNNDGFTVNYYAEEEFSRDNFAQQDKGEYDHYTVSNPELQPITYTSDSIANIPDGLAAYLINRLDNTTNKIPGLDALIYPSGTVIVKITGRDANLQTNNLFVAYGDISQYYYPTLFNTTSQSTLYGVVSWKKGDNVHFHYYNTPNMTFPASSVGAYKEVTITKEDYEFDMISDQVLEDVDRTSSVVIKTFIKDGDVYTPICLGYTLSTTTQQLALNADASEVTSFYSHSITFDTTYLSPDKTYVAYIYNFDKNLEETEVNSAKIITNAGVV